MPGNPYLRQLLEHMEERYAVDREAMPYSDWIVANTTLRKQPFSFKGYEFQRQIVDDWHPNLSVIKCSQVGLALALDTLIPTDDGWTTMGEVRVGDSLFDEGGKPCTVEYVSPVYRDRECFRVMFDDGTSVVADADHRWYVESEKAFDEHGFWPGRGRIPLDAKAATKGVIRTELMRRLHKVGKRNVFAVPNVKPLTGPDLDLPVDAFFLGVWLGDGNLHATCVTSHVDDAPHLMAELTTRGMVCDVRNRRGDTVQFRVDLPRDRSICPRGHDKRSEGVVGPYSRCARCHGQDVRYRAHGEPRETSTPYDTLSRRLRLLGLLGREKFVPAPYLRAPEMVRRDLLRGLLDTDGSITKQGRCSFYNTNPSLVEAVEELVCSLGLKARTRWRAPSSGVLRNGHRIESKRPIAEVSFQAYAEDGVFTLPRKAERLGSRAKGRSSETYRRRVVGVEPVGSVPVRCLTVDSPSHLFLAGRGMVPTHNTETQLRKSMAFVRRHDHTSLIFTFPDEDMQRRNSQTRIQPLVNNDKVFNPATETKPVRSMTTMQIGQSWLYVMHCSIGGATSTPADVLFHDELDLSDMPTVGTFQSRLQNSPWKITQRFGTPTFSDYGIDSQYKVTDQREYFCKCAACGHWQVPEFSLKHVVIPGLPQDVSGLEVIDQDMAERLALDEAFVACERCARPLDLADPSLREWVARFPTRTLARGYKVRPFSVGHLSVKYVVTQLLQAKRLDAVQAWHNTVLGDAYVAGSARLSEAEIGACMLGEQVPEIGRDRPVGIGIDAGGATYHVVLGTPLPGGGVHAFRWMPVPSMRIHETVAALREQYRIVTGTVDLHPHEPDAHRLREATHGVIMPVEYRGNAAVRLVKDETDLPTHIQVNRTKFLDDLVKKVRAGTFKISGYGDQRSVVVAHLRDMVRKEEAPKEATWVKLSGEDHYFHAAAFLDFSFRLSDVMSFISGADPRSTIALGAATMVQEDGDLFTLRRPPRGRAPAPGPAQPSLFGGP